MTSPSTNNKETTGAIFVDLAMNLRTVVISEANRALANAVGELAKSGETWQIQNGKESLSSEKADQDLRGKSYEILASYPDVEGGYLWNDDVVGHSFPTYTEPGSTLLQRPFEHAQVLSALEESPRTSQTAVRIAQDQARLKTRINLSVSASTKCARHWKAAPRQIQIATKFLF
jgi:hypothetical protein